MTKVYVSNVFICIAFPSPCHQAVTCGIQHDYSTINCFWTLFGLTDQLLLLLPKVHPLVRVLAIDDGLPLCLPPSCDVSLPVCPCIFLCCSSSTATSQQLVQYTSTSFRPRQSIFQNGNSLPCRLCSAFVCTQSLYIVLLKALLLECHAEYSRQRLLCPACVT